MFRTMCKSKIHHLKITDKNLAYEGSLTLDPLLMDAGNIVEWEKVHVVNLNNGDRLETYVIPGAKGSGAVCLNGAAARRGEVGDIVIVIAYANVSEEQVRTFRPRMVYAEEPGNRVAQVVAPEGAAQ